MASMISIAAQAPNEISNLQSLSFRAFHKNIFNRFTDPHKINPEAEANLNRQARLRLQKDVNTYVQTLEALEYYLAKLNDGNFEVEWIGAGDDAKPKQRLIGHDTAIRYAKQLGRMKNEILMRVPLKDKEGNDNVGPSYTGTGTEDDPYKVVKGTEDRLFAGTARDEKIHERNAVIPLSFNIKMDGISGIIPLQMFKVAKEKLPIGYQDDRIAFIVHSENHKITAGQDWTVELGGQLVFTSDRDILKGDALAQNPPMPLEEIEEDLSQYEMNNIPNNHADEIDGKMEGFLVAQNDVYNSGWINPIEHKPILGTPWGQERGGNRRHGGGDFKKYYSRGGSVIRAPMDGKCRLVSIYKTTTQNKAMSQGGTIEVKDSSTHDKWCGNEVIIDHYKDGPRDEFGYLKNKEFSGLSSKYCHLKYDPDKGQVIFLQPGQEVVRGQHFAYLGGGTSDTGRGNTSGNHLHYEVRLSGNSGCNYYIEGRTSCGMTKGKDDGSPLNKFTKNPRQPDWWNTPTYGRESDTASEDPRNYMWDFAQGSEHTLDWDTTAVNSPKLIRENPNAVTCNPELVANDPTMAQWESCKTYYRGIDLISEPGDDYHPSIYDFI
jgi:murein DD-endopeptidase MepM/ murein hydrolase activator NlpD